MKQKVTNQLNVIVPRGSFIDEGDGVVSFPDGLTITDNSVQRNGTRYDINTTAVSSLVTTKTSYQVSSAKLLVLSKRMAG